MANDALAQKAQNFTNRGRQALETGRYDLAVEMLSEALNCAPDTLETRRLLRAAQIANFRKEGKSVVYFLADDHVRTVLDQGMEHVQE